MPSKAHLLSSDWIGALDEEIPRAILTNKGHTTSSYTSLASYRPGGPMIP